MVMVAEMTTDTNSFAGARIDFGGHLRGADGKPHDLIEIIRATGPALLGGYVMVFPKDGNHFNVEIEPFGYVKSYDVGAPERRLSFSPSECVAVEQLIRSFFSNADVFAPRLFPPESFLGGLAFQPNWIVQRPPEGR